MPNKKDFGYSSPSDGPGRGGTCDISTWDGNISQFKESSTYLMGWLKDYLWLNSLQLINGYNPFAWAHECTSLANLIRWRDKPVALSIVQARLNIELLELRKRIRLKIVRSNQMRVSSIKYPFCTSVDPVRYDAFDIKDEGIRSSTSLPVREVRMVENADNPTTLLESSHYDIPKSSIGRHSSVLALDFNRERQNTEQLGFGGRTEHMTSAQHSISGWDMNLSGSMFNAGNTY
ncbi:hypothetical protein Golax_024010 [Gossypium laxum]|uniref:Uncharacterized protein n=1 Tax=Gossypium laxum TaxID=34288 RepID=A0A7J8ZAZ9_9ROSI|nr:hypothetical protein [Gossypium laxum]